MTEKLHTGDDVGITEVTTAYDELCAILGAESLETDDDLHLRLAEIEIELGALGTTAQRKEPGDVDWNIVVLKCIELEHNLAGLAIDVLGYYALPDLPPGDNEPFPGTVYAPGIRSNYLKSMRTNETSLMQMRDALAEFIATRSAARDR